ncbi:MAG: PQQ-binding-like beta-propeller repeat protein [Candidatus Solibacter usitatus]|nr:PQQ-binding-like beta-propeller repeat protein [Candidatus Solibacter usitatus]
MPRLIVIAAAACLLGAEEWPQFRGPNGSGVSSSTGLPSELTPAKNVVWKTAAPFGRSSPIVAGSCLFLTATEGEELLTLCLDPENGRVRWRRQIVRQRAHPVFKMNDPASPTPASDGTNVYVFFPDFGLVSYGPDGNERWRHPLGPFENFYGMAAGPIVSGGKVLLLCDQKANSFLLAVDAKTGAVSWKVERPDANLGWSVPVIYTAGDGERHVVAHGNLRVDAYSVETGERRWWAPRSGELTQGVPVFDGDTVYVNSSGYDQPWLPTFASTLAKYDADKDGRISREEFKKDEAAEHFGYVDVNNDGYMDEKECDTARASGVGQYGLVARRLGGRGSLPESTVRWRFKRNLPYVPSPLLYRDVLYLVKEGGIITSLNAATGEIHKQGRAQDALGDYYASPVAADGKVYLVSEAGKVTVLKAGAQWETLAVNDLGEECYATPAIAGGRIYVRTRGTLYCFAGQKTNRRP